MKKFSIIMLCLGLLLAFSVPASALPHLAANEINKFKFTDYTWLVQGPPIEESKDIEAILTLTTISNPDESQIHWQTGDQGAELTGYVYGLHVDKIEPYADGNLYWIGTSNAWFDVYWDTSPDWDPSLPTLTEQIDAATDGDLYWRANFTDYYLLNYWYGPNGTYDGLAPGSDDRFTGSGYFNLVENYTDYPFDIIGTDPNGNPFEFSFDTRFYDSEYDTYLFRSEDPILCKPVPEPATMLLLGSGLLGLAGTARRRFNKKS